jgi:hypothetical protein
MKYKVLQMDFFVLPLTLDALRLIVTVKILAPVPPYPIPALVDRFEHLCITRESRGRTSHEPAIIGQPSNGSVRSIMQPVIGIRISPTTTRHLLFGNNLQRSTPSQMAAICTAPDGALYNRVSEGV